MSNDYYLINKKALPDYYEKVVEIKELIKKGMSVTNACKKCYLSRSTFYKYKNYVVLYNDEINNYLYLNIKLYYKNNIVLSLLNEISNNKFEIIKIIQETPINNIIYLNLMIKGNKEKIFNLISQNNNIIDYELIESDF